MKLLVIVRSKYSRQSNHSGKNKKQWPRPAPTPASTKTIPLRPALTTPALWCLTSPPRNYVKWNAETQSYPTANASLCRKNRNRKTWSLSAAKWTISLEAWYKTRQRRDVKSRSSMALMTSKRLTKTLGSACNKNRKSFRMNRCRFQGWLKSTGTRRKKNNWRCN